MYNASTGAVLAGFPKKLQTFFGVPAPSPAGCDSAHNNQPFLSDPRIAWDPGTGRWFAATLQVENAFGVATGCTFASRYWVAVSASGDPTSTWHVYAFNTANLLASPSAADYTQLGFNGDGIFIGGNQFNQAGSAYVGAWSLGIPKAVAQAGGAISSIGGFGGFTASDGSATRLLDTVQPTVSYGDGAGGPSGEILISSFNESVTENKVVVYDFSNVLNQQSQGKKLSGVVVTLGHAYAQPPNADNYPSCMNCLETIDNRISATPVYMNGNVYATHDTAVNNGTTTNANVHWMVIHPVLQQTTTAGCSLCSTITTGTYRIDDQYLTYGGTTDDWFGVIQPDREGNVFMAYEYGSTSGHVSPSSVYIARRVTLVRGASWGGPSSSGGIFLRLAANATNNSRWGDYEAAAFEGWGRNPNSILFATEYAHSGGDWGTHIDRVSYKNNSQN